MTIVALPTPTDIPAMEVETDDFCSDKEAGDVSSGSGFGADTIGDAVMISFAGGAR